MNLPSNDDVLGISRERYQATLSDLSELRRDNARLKADNARLRAALEYVEYGAPLEANGGEFSCPACSIEDGKPHDKDCVIRIALGRKTYECTTCFGDGFFGWELGQKIPCPECKGTGELTECKEEK